MEIGERILVGNPEGLMSLRVFELNDVYEVGPSETYYEIMQYQLLPTIQGDDRSVKPQREGSNPSGGTKIKQNDNII